MSFEPDKAPLNYATPPQRDNTPVWKHVMFWLLIAGCGLALLGVLSVIAFGIISWLFTR